MSPFFNVWNAPKSRHIGKTVSTVTVTDAQGSGTLAYAGSRSKWLTSGTWDPIRYQAFLNRARRVIRQVRRRKPRRLTRWYAKQRRKARS